MVVITLENCPVLLRGDLTKWLQEISLGVYAGHVSARVRDNLWKRVCAEAKNGRATMVYSARNEQHMDFRVHNTTWEPIDFDGLKLMLRPSPSRVKALSKKRAGFSSALRHRTANRAQHKAYAPSIPEYVVIDLETTGLSPLTDEILEIAALKVVDGEETECFQVLVRPTQVVSESVVKLTGLSKDQLSQGIELEEALESFLAFIGTCPLVMHNSDFDMAFIDAALERFDIDELDNECIDTLALARRRRPHEKSHRLEDLVASLEVDHGGFHRAMNDCRATKVLFENLMLLS